MMDLRYLSREEAAMRRASWSQRPRFDTTEGVRQFAYTPSDGPVCLSRLKGGTCPGRDPHLHSLLGGVDETLWDKDGTPSTYLCQRHTLMYDDVRYVVEQLKDAGWSVTIYSEPSWQHEDHDVFIEVHYFSQAGRASENKR
jgi:hypothetical protein